MSIKGKIAGLTAAGVIVFACVAGATGYASAQEPTPVAGQQAQQARRDSFLSRVAGKLNVSLDQLKQAFKDAALETVDEALSDGRITADQAQKLKDRINSGQTLGIGRFLREHKQERGRAERLAKIRRGLVNSAAAAIGISGDDLRAELKAGKSVADVAAEHNVALDDVKSHITTDVQAKLDELVSGGKLTQERADQALQKLADNLDTLLHKTKGADAPTQ